jgi:hypothetical protein
MSSFSYPAAVVNDAGTYVRRRWRVFPVHGVEDGRCTCRRPTCEHIGKHPRLRDWPRHATTDDAIIRRWWTSWPTANIAFATGAGVLVVDVDPRHGGDVTLAELEHQYGPLPDTARQVTGGGGVHYLLRVEGPVSNATNIRPGIDLRSDGGFIVVPPSQHESGRRYAWDLAAHPDETPLARAPRWLLDLIAVATHRPVKTPGEELRLIPGERNDRLFRLACGWRRKGVGQAALRAMLDAVNRQHCVPPLDDPAELDRIAASAARYQPAREEDAATDALLAQALGMTA